MKYRYFRFLDLKQWDDIAELFVPEATCAYSAGAYSYEGRDAIVEFFRKAMGRETFLSSHKAHHPEITPHRSRHRDRHLGARRLGRRHAVGTRHPRRRVLRGRLREARRRVEDPAHRVQAGPRGAVAALGSSGAPAHRARTGRRAAAARSRRPIDERARNRRSRLGPGRRGADTPPAREELWGESWYLDWAAADCSTAATCVSGSTRTWPRLVVDRARGCGPPPRAGRRTTTSRVPRATAALDQLRVAPGPRSWPEPLRAFRVTSRADRRGAAGSGAGVPRPRRRTRPVHARPHVGVAAPSSSRTR